LNIRKLSSRVWWIRPLILALGKEDCKFKAILAYIETPFLSKKKKYPKPKPN
jgi:hypothetical protein